MWFLQVNLLKTRTVGVLTYGQVSSQTKTVVRFMLLSPQDGQPNTISLIAYPLCLQKSSIGVGCIKWQEKK